MNRTFRKFLAAVLCAGMLAGCGSSASSTGEKPAESGAEQTAESAAEETAGEAEKGFVTITDHADRTVEVPTDPEKVAVLGILPLPSVLTVYLNSAETICAMEPASMNAAKNGILSQLYPEILNVSTDIMDGDDVNIEALLAMEPDIVFFNAGNKAELEKLENAGMTAVGVSPTKWSYDCIRTYNEWISLLNQIYPSRAAGIERSVDDTSNKIYEEIQAKTADIPQEERQKVLFLFQYDENTMITSGKSFFGQWWCDAVGALNAANEVAADNSNAKITMEQVYAWNPDVIVITNFTGTQPEDLYNNAVGSDDWSTVKAVQDHRVYKMPLGTYRTYTPGVDTPMTLKWLAQAVYPDLFEDYDIISDVKEYYNALYGIALTDEQIESMYNPNRAAGSWH
ncbi:MAG: ABC transporter substrate-binding protein [Solobacterium sp.]|nr:ABC transporter substrate-binding protein [Solobacterium sp.]